MTGALCSARLRNGDRCRSVATHGEFCAYHAALAEDLGVDVVANGDQIKKRNARQRAPVIAESEPLEPSQASSKSPTAVRPALALTAAEEVETIRRVLLEAATSTTRETWATCTCPECGKGFRQEISVPDHGARIKAIETLLREGLGRVGEAEVTELKMPTTADEVKNLSWDQLTLLIAMTYANEARAVLDDGDEALHRMIETWANEERETLARALTEVGTSATRTAPTRRRS
jgi:hypothetical protein